MPSRFGLGKLLLPGAIACASLWPGLASATLGGAVSSVQADSQQLRGSMKEADHGSYKVHEIQLPSGTLVREYSALDGTVFAVAWNGPFIPNLRQTLGTYFAAYVAAATAKHADHHHLQIEQSDLVVQASGHMRAFTGRAYLPQAIPTGVSIGDLQ